MSRKILVALSVVMVILFAASAAVRYLGHREFEALEACEEGADVKKWMELSDIFSGIYRAARYIFRFYPTIILLIWLTDRRYFRWSVNIAFFAILFSTIPWVILSHLSSDLGGGPLSFFCQLDFAQTSLVCIAIALTVWLYKRLKTDFGR